MKAANSLPREVAWKEESESFYNTFVKLPWRQLLWHASTFLAGVRYGTVALIVPAELKDLVKSFRWNLAALTPGLTLAAYSVRYSPAIRRNIL